MFSTRLILTLWLVASSAPLNAAEAQVDNARLRALLPGQNKTAGYFNIVNNGHQTITLVGATSSAAQAIEIHQIVHDGNIVRMRRVESVVVAPGETVRFEPGGLHLMLFRVSALTEQTQIQLLTRGGEQIKAVFGRVPVGVE
jgi:copper(I)-binding protein